MRRQRNMAQMKKQIKIPEKQLNKMETSSLSDQSSKHWFEECLRNLVRTA